MANYTGPDPNNLLPGEPWTSQLALASFEDPIAIAEGADGAPRVQSVSLAGIRSPLQQVTGTNYITITDLDRYKWVQLVCGFVGDGSGARSIQLELSQDNGTTWTTPQTVELFEADTAQNGFTVNVGLQDGFIQSSRFATLTVADYNAVRIRQNTSANVGNVLRVVPHLWEDKI